MGFSETLLGLFSRQKNTDRYTQPIYVNSGEFDPHSWLKYAMSTDSKHTDFVSPNNNEYEIFRTTAEVNQVINKGSQLFQNGSWKLTKLNGDIIEDHQVLDLLKKPNAIMSKNDFLDIAYKHWALNGNFFCYKNYPLKTSEYPAALMPLPYDLMKIERTGRYIKQTNIVNIITKYILIDPTNPTKIWDQFEINEILHFKNQNPKDFLLGASPLESLHMSISNLREAYGYINADYAKKGALGMMSPKQAKDAAGSLPISPEKIKKIEKNLSEYEYGTADNKNKILLIDVPSEYVPFSSAIGQHLILETMEANFKRIIDAYGLNQSLFSFLSQSTFNNQENGERQAYQNGIIPVAKAFASALNDGLQLPERGLKLSLTYDHMSCFKENEMQKTETLLKKIDAYQKLIEIGWSEENAAAATELI